MEFWKITPGGNPTVFVEAVAVPPHRRPAVAAAIMNPLHLGCEQVGFVDINRALPRLDMMGGEFCVNATRAFAVLLARHGRLTGGEGSVLTGEVSVSGTDQPVAVKVTQNGKDFRAAAGLRLDCLPLPQEVEAGVFLLRLPGIVHLILEGPASDPHGLAENCAALRRRHHLEAEEAVGCLWLEEKQVPCLFPVVWVRQTESLCLETACGSGSLACALLLCHREGDWKRTQAIRQPSGCCLEIAVEKGADGWIVWVDGAVSVVAEGRLYLEKYKG